MQSYVRKLALLAISAGSALAASGGACDKASQKNTGTGYWAYTPAGAVERNNVVGLETRLCARAPLIRSFSGIDRVNLPIRTRPNRCPNAPTSAMAISVR
jgi:hypothetical protein